MSEPTLTITRVFAAPRSLVFKVWTDPSHAVRWWGPTHHPATLVELDPRPGGAWRACLRSVETGKELWQHGVVREAVAPERLAFTFAWDEHDLNDGLETLVTITFEEQDGQTRMTMRQSPFRSIESRDGHNEGWNSAFDRLDVYLAREEVRAT